MKPWINCTELKKETEFEIRINRLLVLLEDFADTLDLVLLFLSASKLNANINTASPTCADYDCLVRQAGRDVNRVRDSVHAAYQFKQSQLGKHFAIDVCTPWLWEFRWEAPWSVSFTIGAFIKTAPFREHFTLPLKRFYSRKARSQVRTYSHYRRGLAPWTRKNEWQAQPDAFWPRQNNRQGLLFKLGE